MRLQVAVCRPIAEEQSRECELQGGGVTIDHLPGDVQEDAVVVLVRVVQRTVRHQEEVFRGQPERVRGGGGDVRADLLKLDGCSPQTIVTRTNTINVNKLTVHHHASFAIFSTVPNS